MSMQMLLKRGLNVQGFSSLSNVSRNLDVNSGAFMAGIQSVQTFSTISKTQSFNNQYSNIVIDLNGARQDYQQQVNELISSNAELKSTLRSKGVGLAWKYEQAELKMGGKGTTSWSTEEKQEILNTGKVRGAEGHHINSVADNLGDQANPDNIRFAKTKAEHLDMHDGDFRNPTTGELIDRNKRLEQANNERVARNEWSGIGIAAAIGLGVGFTLGFVMTLAYSGLSIDSIKIATAAGVKASGEGALLGVMNHLVVRGIGETATNALQGMIQNVGITITENITRMCNMAIMGGMAIVVFTVYQFCKLKLLGFGTKECLLRVGKSVTFSLTMLVLSIVAQGLYGGYAGLIVSVSIGFVVMVYKIGEVRYNKKLLENIKLYIIKKYSPVF